MIRLVRRAKDNCIIQRAKQLISVDDPQTATCEAIEPDLPKVMSPHNPDTCRCGQATPNRVGASCSHRAQTDRLPMVGKQTGSKQCLSVLQKKHVQKCITLNRKTASSRMLNKDRCSKSREQNKCKQCKLPMHVWQAQVKTTLCLFRVFRHYTRYNSTEVSLMPPSLTHLRQCRCRCPLLPNHNAPVRRCHDQDQYTAK
jgi:hypothetical protein